MTKQLQSVRTKVFRANCKEVKAYSGNDNIIMHTFITVCVARIVPEFLLKAEGLRSYEILEVH